MSSLCYCSAQLLRLLCVTAGNDNKKKKSKRPPAVKVLCHYDTQFNCRIH